MKFISSTLQLSLIVLISNINFVNSNVLREGAQPVEYGEDCVKARNCGSNVNCIAACYNVPSPDHESVLRTQDCQRSCLAKYPDPYLDTPLLNQCYQDCISTEYFTPYSERKKQYQNQEVINTNENSNSNANTNNNVNTNNNANTNNNINTNANANTNANTNTNTNANIATTNDVITDEVNDNIYNSVPLDSGNNNNNNNINNNMNNVNSNNNEQQVFNNNNGNNQTNNNNNNLFNISMIDDDDDGSQIYYLEENNGSKTNHILFTLLITELVLLLTMLYMAL